MAEKTKNYTQLSEELAKLMAWFESDKVDLDAAMQKYEQTMKLIEKMEKYLATSENKIKKITTDLT